MKGLLTYRTIQISMSMSHLCETEILSYLLLKLNLAGSGFGLAFPIWGTKNPRADLIISTRLLRAQLISQLNYFKLLMLSKSFFSLGSFFSGTVTGFRSTALPHFLSQQRIISVSQRATSTKISYSKTFARPFFQFFLIFLASRCLRLTLD